MLAFALLLVSILAGALSFAEKRKDNIQSKKSNNFNLYALLLLILSAGVSYWQGCTADEKSHAAELLQKGFESRSDSMHKVIDSLNTAISVKTDTIDSLIRRSFDTTQTILSYSQKLNVAQREVISLQSEQGKNIIGDGTKPRLIAVAQQSFLICFIMNESDYPMQDVEIAISRPSTKSITNAQSPTTYDGKSDSVTTLPIGTIRRHAGSTFNDNLNFSNTVFLYCVFEVSWRYGSYTTEILAKKAATDKISVESIKYYYNNGKEFSFPPLNKHAKTTK